MEIRRRGRIRHVKINLKPILRVDISSDRGELSTVYDRRMSSWQSTWRFRGCQTAWLLRSRQSRLVAWLLPYTATARAIIYGKQIRNSGRIVPASSEWLSQSFPKGSIKMLVLPKMHRPQTLIWISHRRCRNLLSWAPPSTEIGMIRCWPYFSFSE